MQTRPDQAGQERQAGQARQVKQGGQCSRSRAGGAGNAPSACKITRSVVGLGWAILCKMRHARYARRQGVASKAIIRPVATFSRVTSKAKRHTEMARCRSGRK